MHETELSAQWQAADAAVIAAVAERRASLGRPVLIGLAGAQGSGKSTMARRLVEGLGRAGWAGFAVSLDDFYLTRIERAELAARIHPLLATRGVPGTHDVALMESTLAALLGGKSHAVPSFDKGADDRRPAAQWHRPSGPLDVVLFEGWCVGARPQGAAALLPPANALEAEEDVDGVWRRHVDAQLAGPYARVFAGLDLSILLRAPAFDIVLDWRTEQERGLGPRGMDPVALARFVAHYERLTRWMLADEPADLVLDLDAHRVPGTLRQPL